jgi:hypothetical protein
VLEGELKKDLGFNVWHVEKKGATGRKNGLALSPSVALLDVFVDWTL